MLFPKPQRLDKASPWRYCKNKRCRAVFRKSRQSSTLCPNCWKAERQARQEARKAQRRRPSSYPKPKPKFWGKKARAKQIERVQARCEVCKMANGECVARFGCGLTRDHLLPVRFITEHRLGDPHLDLNIIMICSECHGVKAAAEAKLFRGDFLSFFEDLKRFGWNMVECEMVLRFYGFFPSSLEHLFH